MQGVTIDETCTARANSRDSPVFPVTPVVLLVPASKGMSWILTFLQADTHVQKYNPGDAQLCII